MQTQRDGKRVKVVFVVGKGRSGSTLLDTVLNSIPGFFSTGELWRRWEGRPIEDYLCGCGSNVGVCELWRPILAQARDRASERLGLEVTTEQVMEWERRVERWANVPRLLRMSQTCIDDASPAARLVTFQSEVYKSIAANTGADILVDSSKTPFLPGPLGLIPGVDPYRVHLVRDSRAVTFSWRRDKAFLPGGELQMPQFGAPYSALSWTMRNGIAGLLKRRSGERYLLLRYEDFVDAPRPALQLVLSMLDVRRELPLVGDRIVDIEPNHTIWGNKSRFRTGSVEIRRDREWQDRISLSDGLIATAMTWPLLLRYGYAISWGRVAGSSTWWA